MASAAIMTGLSLLSGLGGAFGKQKQVSDTTNTTTPNYDPASLAFKNFLLQKFTDLSAGQPAWNKAYEASGLQNILRSAQVSGTAANDILAARGLNRTTAGANSIMDQSQQQGRSVSGFLNQAPIVEQQQNLNNLNAGGSFLSSLPVGSTNISHTVGTGGPSSPVTGFIGGGAQGLAAALGQKTANDSFAKILKNAGFVGDGFKPAGGSPIAYNVPGIPKFSLPIWSQ